MLKIALALVACFSVMVSAGCAGGVGKGKTPIHTRG